MPLLSSFSVPLPPVFPPPFRHKGVHGAFAVCLSGGYKDDSDEGNTFWYTGVGGQSKGAGYKGSAAKVRGDGERVDVRGGRGGGAACRDCAGVAAHRCKTRENAGRFTGNGTYETLQAHVWHIRAPSMA